MGNTGWLILILGHVLIYLRHTEHNPLLVLFGLGIGMMMLLMIKRGDNSHMLRYCWVVGS